MGFAIFDALSGGTPDYAGEAEKAEAKRQAAIKRGTANINRQFAGFNDDFYKQREQAYIDYAMPQLSDQYQTTRNQLGYNLANRGVTRSTTAGKTWSDLFRQTATAKQGIADAAIGQASDLRRQVAQSQNQLINDLYTTADPAGANQAAISTAAGFRTPSTFGPLVNQFSGLLNQYYISQLLNTKTNVPTTTGTGTGDFGSGFAPIPAPATSSNF